MFRRIRKLAGFAMIAALFISIMLLAGGWKMLLFFAGLVLLLVYIFIAAWFISEG